MNYLHYQSDFSLVINGVDFPDYDFTVELFTDGSSVFTASYIGGMKTNVANVDGAIQVVADNHGMGTGRVVIRLTRYIPDSDYPDSVRTVVDRLDTDITLVAATHTDDADEDTDGGISVTLVSPFGDAAFAPDGDAYRLHYQSDFSLVINGVDFPDYDFTVELFTDGSSVFTASYIDGVATNIANADGVIHVIADGHGLSPGRLRCRLSRDVPDIDFPDGVRTAVDETTTNIVLTTSPAEATVGDDSGDDSGVSAPTIAVSYEDPSATTVLATESDDIVVTEGEESALLINR